MNMPGIIFHPKKPWKRLEIGHSRVYHAGHFINLPGLVAALERKADLSELEELLRAQPLQFGLMIEHPCFVFAACDRTRSFSIYTRDTQPAISNHAPSLSKDLAENIDQDAFLAFCTSAYTIGERTLHKSIKSLDAGRFKLASQGGTIETREYFSYSPFPVAQTPQQALAGLGEVLDTAIKDCIARLDGAPLWIPLSGGMDSRLILSKFHEHKYPRLKCFSYGLRGNDEALIARQVAARLGVEWHMIEARPAQARALFQSPLRHDYDAYLQDYHTAPSYVEFEAIHRLRESGLTSPGSFIINGQTGDFISGGHIPACLYETAAPELDDLLDYCIFKHFSLWESLKGPETLESLKRQIKATLAPPARDLSDKENLMRQYEFFEWSHRQCKMVVNAAHVYDYFDYGWMLPLWHSAVIDFFAALPFAQKYKQSLFMAYLNSYNYKGVFEMPRAVTKTWKPHQYWIIAAAKLIEATRGAAAKKDFYKKMSYYGNAHHQYALFGRSLHARHYKDLRNMISLSILDYCEQNSLPSPPLAQSVKP